MICPKCGTQNVDQAIYCAKCGEKLQKDSKTAPKNNNIMILILAAVIIILVFVCMAMYMHPKTQSKTESISDKQTLQDDSENNKITKQDLADTRWYMFVMYDMDGNEVDPYDIVEEYAADYYADNYLDFYSKDSYVEEEKFGMFLSFYTFGEGDGLRWGDYRCEDNLVYLGCDIHGDEISLEHTTLNYSGENLEVLKLTDEVYDKYGNAQTYQMYFRIDLEYLDRMEEY